MNMTLASSITKTASKQSYYTIRFLADKDRLDNAYRAYAYFRWVDDVLDADSGTRNERRAFLLRQRALLEACYQGKWPREVDLEEEMLVELVMNDREKNSRLQAYLRNMMQLMDFDARRRGRLISRLELNNYTHWLAVAVTECLHYFIGHEDYAPHDETRYQAVSGAHIIHMLRDTFDDMQAGYINIPREVLVSAHIEPQDVHTDAYRSWVKGRVQLARKCFTVGRDYFHRVQNLRHRLAGLAYMSRFEWLLETIEREDYILRPQYRERRSISTGLKMSRIALSSLAQVRVEESSAPSVVSQQQGKA